MRLLVFLLLVAGVLAVVTWRLARRLREAERQLRELRLVRRDVEDLRGEVERGLAVTRTHLAATVAGEPPDRDVILRGRAYRNIEPAAAQTLFERDKNLFVLDVRTPAEYASGHIPGSHLIPLDELEDRLRELPGREHLLLVHCAAGGRSLSACETLSQHGYTRLLNLVGGMHTWPGPRVQEENAAALAPAVPAEVAINERGGSVTGAQVVAAIRECFDPEIPLNIYDLGLIYGIDIDEHAIAVKMTLTSEACPSARSIPEDVKRKIAALGQPNVSVDVVWDPPWHPSRISEEGKQKLGLD
jgi:metal-sulfur cluster biosynthetic enzyme/rhodanese-related sulfurtransferase